MLGLFIALAVLLLLAVLFFIFFPKAYRKYASTNYKKIYGKKIYRFAINEDFYLINNLKLKTRLGHFIKADHVVFGNKFIYVISDYNFRGEIEAKEIDNLWVLKPYKNEGKTCDIKNPLIEGKKTIERVAESTGLDLAFFISISVLNNDVIINDFEVKSDTSKYCKIKDLKKTIMSYEKREIGVLDDNLLKYAVKDIAALNVKDENNG